MMRQMLLGKIHRAVVTGADLNYVGSITIDPLLMHAAGIQNFERVQVVDIDNGARLETYAIPGVSGSGSIQLNGAAARLVSAGDKVIVMNYGWLNEEEIAALKPRLVFVDATNHITEIRTVSSPAEMQPDWLTS